MALQENKSDDAEKRKGSRTIVLVLIVMTAMLLFTEDVTVADPRPELSCVNLV